MNYRNERGKMLLSRRNQLLLEFSFWNEPVPRPGPNIYELRSYQLRVTLIFYFHHLPRIMNAYILLLVHHVQQYNKSSHSSISYFSQEQ